MKIEILRKNQDGSLTCQQKIYPWRVIKIAGAAAKSVLKKNKKGEQ